MRYTITCFACAGLLHSYAPCWRMCHPSFTAQAWYLEEIFCPSAQGWLWSLPRLARVSCGAPDGAIFLLLHHFGATHSASNRLGSLSQLPALGGITATHSPVWWRYWTTGKLNCQKTKAMRPMATAKAANRSLITLNLLHHFAGLFLSQRIICCMV